MPKMAQRGRSDGSFTRGKVGRTDKLPLRGEEQELGNLGLGRLILIKDPGKQCFWQEHTKGLYIWGCPSTGSQCHMSGQDDEETAASQWPLVQCIRELSAEEGMDSRSLTARKHTLESTDGFCKPMPDQESSNSFSYLVWGILMDCMATLW